MNKISTKETLKVKLTSAERWNEPRKKAERALTLIDSTKNWACEWGTKFCAGLNTHRFWAEHPSVTATSWRSAGYEWEGGDVKSLKSKPNRIYSAGVCWKGPHNFGRKWYLRLLREHRLFGVGSEVRNEARRSWERCERQKSRLSSTVHCALRKVTSRTEYMCDPNRDYHLRTFASLAYILWQSACLRWAAPHACRWR